MSPSQIFIITCLTEITSIYMFCQRKGTFLPLLSLRKTTTGGVKDFNIIKSKILDGNDSGNEMSPKVKFNTNPVLMPIGDKSVDEGVLLIFNIVAEDIDIDWDTLTLTTSTLPSGADFTDNGNGQGTFNWTPGIDQQGDYSVTFTVTDLNGDTDEETITITVNNTQAYPPTVSIDAVPPSIISGETSILNWMSTDADNCEIDQGIGVVGLNGAMSVSPAEDTTYTITATGLGGTATDSATVTVTDPQYNPPTISLTADQEIIQKGETAVLTWTSQYATSVHINNGIGAVADNGSIPVTPEHTTVYTATATGPDGSASSELLIKVTHTPQPPEEGSFGDQYADLIPDDATLDEYDEDRFAVVTGQVNDENDQAIADVLISILNHPEYGTAKTDINGQYSLPVEGGGTLTVIFQKQGLLTAHRQVLVPWNDIAIVETIKMIAEDTKSTTLSFDGNPSTVVVHESTEIIDEFGSRSSTTVFTGDNRAYAVDANGNNMFELTTITTRATEFSTPETMPAVLPPTSAFTYCAELKVDGVERVRFEDPVVTYVDNFLGFDVGGIVPVGYYDRDRGVWVPSENGVVVKLLDENSDGIVDALDADGDDIADDLDEDGFFDDEVIGLDDPAEYAPDSTYWRVKFNHFTPWDCNWPYGPPDNAIDPNPSREPIVDQQFKEGDDCNQLSDSFVSCRSRIYNEDIAIPGTDLTLHYASNRVEDYNTVIKVPASGDSVPPSLKRIIVKMEIAGKAFEQVLDPLPNQQAEFIWDGLDHLGERAKVATAHIEIGFVYDGVYWGFGSSPNPDIKFGLSGTIVTGIQSRQEIVSWLYYDLNVTNPISINNIIVDGWTLSNHHSFLANRLYKGDGSQRDLGVSIIETIAGTGQSGWGGGGTLRSPWGVAADNIGNVYNADTGAHIIRKIDPNGIITGVAGVGQSGYSGDGGPATQAHLNGPTGIAVDNIGNLYIADDGNHCIRKVDANGIITTLAGTGTAGFYGDGGLAANAQLNSPRGVAVDDDGNVYIADMLNHRIRKVDPNGIISTVAGSRDWGNLGDGGPAISARLIYPYDVTLDKDGNMYIADPGHTDPYDRIRKVDTSGIITSFVANLDEPYGVATDNVGNLYIAESGRRKVKKVDRDGVVSIVAGSGTYGDSGDGGPPTNAEFKSPYSIALDTSGNLYIVDMLSCRVRKVSYAKNFINPDEDIVFTDQTLQYIFSQSGQHKKTIDLDTGKEILTFGYDTEDRLVTVTDHLGNQVTIQRDAAGIPTVIVSPDGITTQLVVDANNHLKEIHYPDTGTYTFDYSPGGLMTKETEPEGNFFTHTYDANGRVTDVVDQENGHQIFDRQILTNGDIQTRVETAEGNITTYLDHTDTNGTYTSTITDPNGLVTDYTRSADELAVSKTLPDGTLLDFTYDYDPEHKTKYIKDVSVQTPVGLTLQTTSSRTYTDTNTDDIIDRIERTVTVNSKTVTSVHDTLTAQITQTSPLGRTVTSTYDPNTLLTSSVSVPGLLDTTYGYDPQGRITLIKTGVRETVFTYDPSGNIQSIEDPKHNTTTFEYDAVGRTTRVHRPDTTDIYFDYDLNGNMTVLTNPAAVDHKYTYNKVNGVETYDPPVSPDYSYTYDKDRRLLQKTFPSGQFIKNIYTNTQLTQIQTPEGNVDMTYFPSSGNLQTVSKGGESVTYGYDGSLVTSKTLAGTLNLTLSYVYNNDFLLTDFTYAGSTSGFGYDNDGLLTSAGGYTITRNALNGLPESVGDGTFVLGRVFNGYGELENQTVSVDSTSVNNWSLTFDDNGRIETKYETVAGISATYGYEYDSIGRLTKVYKDSSLVEEYVYTNGIRSLENNSLRGISGKSYNYNDEDQLLTAGQVVYQYNQDGFLWTKVDGIDSTTYDYSSRGELLEVALPDGRTIEYVHGPLGRRVAKKVNGAIEEKYLWNGLTQLLAVYDGSDNLVMRFEYADARMPFSMEKGGSTYYLTFDQVGSLRAVTDASGTVVKRVDYDSFGNILTDTAPAFSILFGFAGGLHDRDTNLVRFGFRDYDPEIGRWTAKDPIGFYGGDIDLYGYCLDDPLNLIDFIGLRVTDWSGVLDGSGGLPYVDIYDYDGYYVVIAHSDSQKVAGKGRKPCANVVFYDAQGLAEYIHSDSNYIRGQTVILLACGTGMGDNPYAQDLANELSKLNDMKTIVIAPTTSVLLGETGFVVSGYYTRNNVDYPKTKGNRGVFNPGKLSDPGIMFPFVGQY